MSDPQNSSPNALPRVALVHDWLTGMRGGEKVLELLCERFPEAPIWTLLYNSGAISKTIAAHIIHPSLLQRMPKAAGKYRNYLPFFPLFAELNKADASEVVISTSHAVAKSMVRRRKQGAYHICYIHTPMRYAWDLFEDYFGPERVGWLASRLFFRPIIEGLRLYDIKTLKRVDLFIANSTYVAERVRKFYHRDAQVIPPPVDTERFHKSLREPQDWYLVVSALVPYKRVDRAILACGQLGLPLKIVGQGPELVRLQALAQSCHAHVEFLGAVSDHDLSDFYRQGKALLFPGVEDFGIVPVEAIASGCPVIALAEGGILDSMTEKTAILYGSSSVEGLCSAIKQFEATAHLFQESDLRERADFFSNANFQKRFEAVLTQVRSGRQA